MDRSPTAKVRLLRAYGRYVRATALSAAVLIVLTPTQALAATYPSPAFNFGPVAGANPLYNAANAATPRPLLVSLVTYSDLASPAGFTEPAQAARVFGPAFPNLAGYFAATSFNKMGFTRAQETCGSATNDGVVTVNVGANMTWTGLPDPTASRVVLDAVNALGCVNFANFDANGDGTLTDNEVSFLLIDATPRNCGATRGINPGAVYNGKSIAAGKGMSFSASGANILTLAHEVAHQNLGARDLYGFGVGAFDLFGPTCGAADTTMFAFNAWQKMHLGWLTPTVVTRDGFYDVPRADTNAKAFLLYDPDRGTNDYFMVENRQPTATTYDQNATDSGLAIWRADDSQYASGVDTVRPIDIMRPDGVTNPGCSPTSCYGGSNGDAWNPSDPASPQRTMARGWRDGAASNVAVRAIGDSGSSVRAYFDVRGPGVLVDTYAQLKAAPPQLTLGSAGTVSFPVMNTGEATDTFGFTAGGLPAGWTATTDTQTLAAGAAGSATVSVTPPLNGAAGLYSLTALGTSTSDASVTSNSVLKVKVVRRPTAIAYTGDTTGDYHDAATVSAVLTDALSGSPLAAKLVELSLGTQTASATTDAAGVGAATITVTQAPATVGAGASFAGDATYLAATSPTADFIITREETTTQYVGPTVILQGASGVTLSARLLEDGTTAPVPSGQTITLSLGAQSCAATADATGLAACTLTFTGPLGPQPLAATFAGDTYYEPSADTGRSATVFAFPSRGAFVIGDGAAALPASSVTWWGANWPTTNSLSGGSVPASFKGFAGTVALPTTTPVTACGGSWSTRPGNSPPPTADVPSYMGVLVANSAGQSGSIIGGNAVSIVVVKTDAGYSPDPGHAGTGAIVATYC